MRAIESVLNYVEANRPALLAENVFYTSGLPDEAGEEEADEEDEYEEESSYGEPPRRNGVLYLRSALVPYHKLSPEEQIEALEAGQEGWDFLLSFGGLDDWGYSVKEDYIPIMLNCAQRFQICHLMTFLVLFGHYINTNKGGSADVTPRYRGTAFEGNPREGTPSPVSIAVPSRGRLLPAASET